MVSLCRNSILSLSILLYSPVYSDDIELVVDVLGVKPGIGYVALSIFSSPEDHMVQPVIEKTMKVNDAKNVTFVLKGLARGRYSLSVFYDENGNAELDTGMFGIPKELVGSSNNARGLFGPPSFDDASFDLSISTRMVIQLHKATE